MAKFDRENHDRVGIFSSHCNSDCTVLFGLGLSDFRFRYLEYFWFRKFHWFVSHSYDFIYLLGKPSTILFYHKCKDIEDHFSFRFQNFRKQCFYLVVWALQEKRFVFDRENCNSIPTLYQFVSILNPMWNW